MSAADWISAATRFAELGDLALESGTVLPQVRVAYRTWGRLTAERDNAVVVCHALTGSADVDRWWPALLGPGRALDPERDFIVCSNVVGGCYGSTGPLSTAPGAGAPWGPDFPALTVRDMVRAQMRLLDRLGVRRVALVVGGSLGGMQVLEWALLDPERVAAIAPLATAARHSPWCIAWSEAQRQAIEADPAFRGGRYPPAAPPRAGLVAARMAAMVSYRSPASLALRFARRTGERGFAVEEWLRFHGEQLVERFDANTYVALTRAMDRHDVARGRGPLAAVLSGVRVPALVLAIRSDVLYPPSEQEELAALLAQGELVVLDSPHGHDAFLIDGEAVSGLVRDFRRRLPAPRRAVAAGGLR